MALERDIHRLLHTHDCVVVPGFGGFLAHYRPARLDAQRALLHPPGKDVSFNKLLHRTDGLLAQEVMRREQLDHAAADRVVASYAARWKDRLDRNGRLELDRIGTFFHDAERNLQFVPDKRMNFLKDAYGLRPVAAIPVRDVRPAPVTKVLPMPVQADEAREGVEGNERSFPWWRVAAGLVLGSIGLWWLSAGGGAAIGERIIAWRAERPKPTYVPLQYAGIAPFQFDDTAPWSAPPDVDGVVMAAIAGGQGPLVAVDMGTAPVEEEHASQVPPTGSGAPETPVLRFHIIGGCFQEKENADRFAAELQARGFAASVIDRKGGLYRVAYGSYAKRAMALEALSAVRKEEAPEAWLLVR